MRELLFAFFLLLFSFIFRRVILDEGFYRYLSFSRLYSVLGTLCHFFFLLSLLSRALFSLYLLSAFILYFSFPITEIMRQDIIRPVMCVSGTFTSLLPILVQTMR